MKKAFLSLVLFLIPLLMEAQSALLIRRATIFNGKDEKTTVGDVLIEGNRIRRVSSAPLSPQDYPEAQVIDGTGKFLMPGLIDAHWHSYLCCNTMMDLLMAEPAYLQLRAGREAGKTLLRGFTSIRDAGGPVFGLKRAIDEGTLTGPRIYPCGAMISQTSGHADFRPVYELPRPFECCELNHTEAIGAALIADGADAVTVATRNNLRKGASQIKLMAGGGVASLYDPLDVTEYFEEEMRAAVKAADDWGTYVMVHAYTPRSVQRAIEAGVRCIEHGQLLDEPTMKLIADRGIWICIQPFDESGNQYPTPEQQAKKREVNEGTNRVYELAKKYRVKLAWGTDRLFNPAAAAQQSADIVKMKRWFNNFQILKMITFDNAQLLALCGKRNPYPGPVGFIGEGALADVLLVDGNALENIELLADPEKNLLVIVKDGVIYKNVLDGDR